MPSEATALVTIALISVWQYIGIPMMLIYAALLAVPEEIVEAAMVEGAGSLRIFWQIKLPLIYPTLGLVTILTFVGNFNAFDLIYAALDQKDKAREAWRKSLSLEPNAEVSKKLESGGPK